MDRVIYVSDAIY